MPSDSIAGFLDKAQASRVLFPEQIEQLIRQPDIPQRNLEALCEYLESHGAITRFQAEAIRGGRGHDLSFAGYPVLDELGPCPGGTAYRSLHPSLRTPVVIRRFRGDDLFPTDTVAGLMRRAQTAAGLHHPHLATLLDAGTHDSQPYAAIDLPADFATLETLVRDIGAMPGFLAAEFGRQAATALRAAHERGLWHGDVRPANLLVGPMTTKPGPNGTTKRRPAPNAAVKLAELGLVPVRPAGHISPPAADTLPYLPPERIDDAAYTPRGDLYGLGATLYYLLSGRVPFAGGSAHEVLEKIKSAEPAPLEALRPDIPTGFAAVVHQLMSKRPEDRPATAFDVEQALAPFCRPGSVPAAPSSGDAPVPVAIPYTDPQSSAVVPEGEARPSSADDWGTTAGFSLSSSDSQPIPKRVRTPKEKFRTRLLIGLGLLLHITAVSFCLLAFFFKVFEKSDELEPVPVKKEQPKKQKKSNPKG